ncbi:MAG TPA: cytochrome c biogenesis protein CcdA [Micropruina sp.]|nr:cytochrome c biogenesis protein CcdA [Micropruina sp.]HMR21642.1 cytochrome c biogenesis protein CcdA [Micropruina sp.]
MALAVPVALLAGLISFFSPCVLPLLPGYLSYASGLSAAQLADGSRRGRVLAGTSLFVLGFAVVFVSGGVLFGSLGTTLMQWRDTLTVIGGVLAIVLGLVFAGWVPFASRTIRLDLRPRVGLAAAPLLGIVFALGWTPCIGPALQVVLTLALNEATALRGAVLAFCYALGLGLPFLIAGVALDRFASTIAFVKRHHRALQVTGGVMMIAVGVLLLTGGWEILMGTLRQWAASYGTVI